MSTNLPKLTAKDFEAPLLTVMATLSQETAGAVIKASDTYPLVFGALGITEDAYGDNAATGIPMTVKWTQWAFRSLRDQGLGNSGGRGKWVLTADGVKAARKLNKPAAPATTPAPEKPVEKKTVETPTTDAVSLPLGEGFDDSYSDDPYLRKLALDASNCAGAWSPRSDKCKICGLVGSCRNVQASLMSRLALILAKEDEAAKAPATAPVTSPDIDKGPKTASKAPVSGLAGKYDLRTAETLVIRAPTYCTFCQDYLPTGSYAIWVEAHDETTYGAIFHKGCFEQIKAEDQ